MANPEQLARLLKAQGKTGLNRFAFETAVKILNHKNVHQLLSILRDKDLFVENFESILVSVLKSENAQTFKEFKKTAIEIGVSNIEFNTAVKEKLISAIEETHWVVNSDVVVDVLTHYGDKDISNLFIKAFRTCDTEKCFLSLTEVVSGLQKDRGLLSVSEFETIRSEVVNTTYFRRLLQFTAKGHHASADDLNLLRKYAGPPEAHLLEGVVLNRHVSDQEKIAILGRLIDMDRPISKITAANPVVMRLRETQSDGWQKIETAILAKTFDEESPHAKGFVALAKNLNIRASLKQVLSAHAQREVRPCTDAFSSFAKSH